MLDTMLASAHQLGEPYNLLAILLGSLIGFTFGALPGLGSIQALTLLLPFTFGLKPVIAMYLYAGVMGAAPQGGSVPAILLNIPHPINAATCLDGYPMARKGQAGRALGLSAASSVLGALFGLVVLVVLIPFTQPIVLAFGPPEIFWLVVFGLVSISFASKGNMIKGLAAGGLGILLSMIGYSDVFGVERWTAGSQYLWDGVNLVAFFVGIFAISEAIELSLRGGTIAEKTSQRITLKNLDQVFQGAKEVFSYPTTFVRSSLIGTLVGIVPGVGGAVANLLAYTTTLQVSKNRHLLGTGHPEGIIASEASIEAKDGGSIFPTLAFGIPGSAEMAILLGAMILLGVHPGPMIMSEHAEVIWALIFGLIVSNVLASLFTIGCANALSRLTFLSVNYIVPSVIVLSVVGTYALRGNLWDVGLMISAGFLGFWFKHFGYPIISLAIGFVLGGIAEGAFYQSLMISYGSYHVFFSRPISLLLMSLTMAVLIWALISARKRAANREQILRRRETNASLIFTAILAVFVLTLLISALRYSGDVRMLPLVIGAPTLALLVFRIGLEFGLRVKEPAGAKSGVLAEKSAAADAVVRPLAYGVAEIGLWLAGFVALFGYFGFFASMPIFVLGFLVLRGKVGWLEGVAAAVAAWLFCYFAFDWAFELKIWPGAISEIIPGLIGGGVAPAI